jgi:phage regulator Rha-like protein
MPGQKAKFEGDPSIKYQVKRVNKSIPVSKKGRMEIIRTNLEYEAALALIKGFNEMEGNSQTIRNEEALRKEQL